MNIPVVVVETGKAAGVSATKIAAMFVAGRVIATGLCLTTPSVYLGLGLMGITYKEAFKRAFAWTLIISMILVYFAALVVP
ncbi:MAG: hypothetical protein LBK02_10095 [Treponema sp.]|nr:hypothetical protein [Treponema sp.]